MCGISAVLCEKIALASVICSLNKLQNRGYDSAGIATVTNELLIKKYVSDSGQTAIQSLNTDPISKTECNVAIGHTRWATHGEKTVENAHPHTDSQNRFALVHNGIIENYLELKETIIAVSQAKTKFYGQTDSEVAVKYLELLISQGNSYRNWAHALKGTWAIVMIDRLNPDRIYFLKNGSPLVLGYRSDFKKIMLVSEISGFDPDIEYYYPLNDNEVGYVSIADKVIVTCNTYVSQKLSSQEIILSPDPYPHWTIKEINDQPNAIEAVLNGHIVADYIDGRVTSKVVLPELQTVNDLDTVEHYIFLACGTSYHAAQFGARYFREFGIGATIDVIDGGDFELLDVPCKGYPLEPNRKSIMILLSQSGETRDLYQALQIGKKMGMKSIGLINVENSLIAREVDACLYLKAGREHAVASTKCFTNQIVLLLILALYFAPKLDIDVRARYIQCLKELPDLFRKIIKQCYHPIEYILPFFDNQNDCFLLGKQQCKWIAYEGSLKIKEISYIHSEAYSAAALKHGPFSLLTSGTPVIMIANNDKFYTKIENSTAEIRSRHAKVIYITNHNINPELVDYLFYFETDSLLFPLLSVVPLQILAYKLALKRGHNPDYPRNLAKVVTVE